MVKFTTSADPGNWPNLDTFFTIAPLIIGVWSWFWYQNDCLITLYKRVRGFEAIRPRFPVENYTNVIFSSHLRSCEPRESHVFRYAVFNNFVNCSPIELKLSRNVQNNISEQHKKLQVHISDIFYVMAVSISHNFQIDIPGFRWPWIFRPNLGVNPGNISKKILLHLMR